MSCNVELSPEETLCLHQYFERVDETEDLSFRYPAEYMAFQRIAGQVCMASAAMLQENYDRLLKTARPSIARDKPQAPSSPEFAPRTRTHAIARGTPAGTACLASRALVDASVAILADESREEILLREVRVAFELGDVAAAASLFARDARVVSPFRGCDIARDFLTDVVSAAGGARLAFHEVRTNVEGRRQAHGTFVYDGWRSDEGEIAGDADAFDVVVNIEAESARIQSMIVM